jgi:hypothetical protein
MRREGSSLSTSTRRSNWFVPTTPPRWILPASPTARSKENKSDTAILHPQPSTPPPATRSPLRVGTLKPWRAQGRILECDQGHLCHIVLFVFLLIDSPWAVRFYLFGPSGFICLDRQVFLVWAVTVGKFRYKKNNKWPSSSKKGDLPLEQNKWPSALKNTYGDLHSVIFN